MGVASEIVPPSGTVTFLFTDVEGSTALWEEHRADMERALERHDEIVRSAWKWQQAHPEGYTDAETGRTPPS